MSYVDSTSALEVGKCRAKPLDCIVATELVTASSLECCSFEDFEL